MSKKISNNYSSYIIYLIGNPGTGKYTIAKELAKNGFIICDNQLINNPIFTLMSYSGFGDIPEFAWNTIAKIRKNIFDFLEEKITDSYVLTNCLYENTGDIALYMQVKEMAYKRQSVFVPVKLVISKEENLKRITQDSRRERWKSIDPQDVYLKEPLITIQHTNLLELNVSELSQNQAAKRILQHMHKLKN